jgi:hypothetical protein
MTINFVNENGFDDEEAIRALAGLLKGLDVGCGVDVEAGADYAEIIRVKIDSWVVVFRNVGDEPNSAGYSKAKKAAVAIYYGKHFQ